jgi:hypothetical protein
MAAISDFKVFISTVMDFNISMTSASDGCGGGG